MSRSRLAWHTPTACASTGRLVAYESHRSEASLEATFYIRIEIEDTVAPHVSMASFHLVSATSESDVNLIGIRTIHRWNYPLRRSATSALSLAACRR